MRDMLAAFEAVSSQKINPIKFSFFFSANTPNDQKTFYGNPLGMQVVEKLDNYLRLPLYVGKSKTNSFHFLLNRFTNKIKGWSKRLLS